MTMEDTDNDLSEDLLSELSETDPLVSLPPDYPWWSEAVLVMEQLALCRTSDTIQENLNKLGEITASERPQNNTLSYFLDSVCGEEERQLLCDLIIPSLVTVALQITKLKPYIGLETLAASHSDSRLLHPDFVTSIICHSFLSTTGRESLNLNLNWLDPQSSDTHWKLRCYFSYFHSVFQDNGSRSNLRVLKQVAQAERFSLDGLKDRKLIKFVITDDSHDVSANCLRLTFLEDFAKGLVTDSNPMNSEFSLKRPQLLLSFLLVEDLEVNEAVRVTSSSSDCGNLTVVRVSEMRRTETCLTLCLESLLLGMSQDWSPANNKSLLRRPSVSAVTSCSSSPSIAWTESSPDQPSHSDLSCHRSGRVKGEVKRNKTKKKESFNERLKAALERGNTPDESDDQSAPKIPLKPMLPLHKRLIKRQRSSGFKTFNDLDDSEEFFTATEDERSHTPARRLGPLRVVPGRRMVSSPTLELPASNPGLGRRISTVSSSPGRSPSTCSSNLASDSESFSSEGLGMPEMEDECLEDLCDKLHGCLETEEGGLSFRNLELKRAVRSLGVRSLSQSYLTTISDLDQLGRSHLPRLDSEQLPTVLTRSYSCPHVFSRGMTESREIGEAGQNLETLETHSLSRDTVWMEQVWPLLVWLSASSSSHYHTVSFNTLGNTNLQDLAGLCQLIEDNNLTAAALFQIIVDFLSSQTDNFFTFLRNKLVAN